MSDPGGLAGTYARWRATTLGRLTEEVEVARVRELVGDVAGMRVLDVGCGDGTYAIDAATRGARATGVDPDPAMLAAARGRAAARGVDATWVEGRVEALPFPDGAFDLALAITVLCFVPDPARAFAELARVVAPGGRVVVGELGRWSVWAAGRRLRGWLGARTWRHARSWTAGELAALARGAGLRVERVGRAVYFPPSGLAARAVAPLEPALARLGLPGAAFVALAAARPRQR